MIAKTLTPFSGAKPFAIMETPRQRRCVWARKCLRRAAAVWLGGEPVLERRPGQLGVRSREQRTVGGGLAVRVGRGYLLDPDLVAAPGRDQPRQAGEVLFTRARQLRNRRSGGLGRTGRGEPGLGADGRRGEGLGDGPGGDDLGAHPRQVDHVALAAQFHEHADELMELRDAQDPRGHRAGQRGLLVSELGRPVAAGGLVDPDDRDDHVPGHAGPLPGRLQVPGGGGEELGGGSLLRARPGTATYATDRGRHKAAGTGVWWARQRKGGRPWTLPPRR